MKNDRGKRAFILAVLVVFVALYAVCTGNGTDPETGALLDDGLENKSLTFELRDGGALYIGGEGKLSAADLDALRREHSVHSTDVNQVVIAGGITEIGYNVLNGYKYLETVKLGGNTTVVANGAIKNCPALRFIYLPATLTRVGQDFLFNCGQPTVVTDAAADALPELPEIVGLKVLSDIHSLDDLNAWTEERACLSFTSDQLLDEALEPGDVPMALQPGEGQVGPFATVERGVYTVRVRGENFDAEPRVDLDCFVRGTLLDRFDIVTEGDCVTYGVVFPETTPDVEFRTFNHSDSVVVVDGVEVVTYAFQFPDIVRSWWEDSFAK